MPRDKFEMTTGQAHELAMALGRNDWTNEEVKKLCEGTLLSGVRSVLLGYAKIKPCIPVVDCDANPFTTPGWKVEEHRKGGKLLLDMTKVKLIISPRQISEFIECNQLRKELKKEPVLNANFLDYLLAHPALIPEEWKDKETFFWGTIYRNPGGDLYVRCLREHNGMWEWNYHWLGVSLGYHSPAAAYSA